MRKSNVAGYSLLEITVTLLVLGALISFAIPQLSTERRKLKLETQKVVEFLRQAQALAFYSASKVSVRISTNELTLISTATGATASQRLLILSDPIQVNSWSHSKMTFSPAGTGTAGHLTLTSSRYSCTVTNSLFNRLRYRC